MAILPVLDILVSNDRSHASHGANYFPSFLAFTDYCIYWAHRWLHIPVIYRWLHKPHHKWLST